MKKVIFALLTTFMITSCAQNEILDEITTEEFSHQAITEELLPTSVNNSNERELYDFEKEYLIGLFPNLSFEIDDIRVFCDPTGAFNCIGNALGVAEWINPPKNIGAFQDLFVFPQRFWYFPPEKYVLCERYSDAAIIDGWGQHAGNMTHASRRNGNA